VVLDVVEEEEEVEVEVEEMEVEEEVEGKFIKSIKKAY
jgi:hypothetical protein